MKSMSKTLVVVFSLSITMLTTSLAMPTDTIHSIVVFADTSGNGGTINPPPTQY